MSAEEERIREAERRLEETKERLRRQEERLEKLRKRLKRGEISEETFEEIKERHKAVPEPPEPPEEPLEPETTAGLEDLGPMIEESIGKAMEQVGKTLEATFESEKFEERMEEVGRRVREAIGQIGPKVEAGGKRIIIRAAGSVSPEGPIEILKCTGSGKVKSDLNAEVVRISGACKIDGTCETSTFHSSGSAAVASNLTAQEFHSSGSTAVGGDLRAQEIHSSGSLKVKGSILDAQEVHSSGALKVDQWVRAKEFNSAGGLAIGEGIEAEEVKIKLSGTSKVPRIQARKIAVQQRKRAGELMVDTIEGEEIHLEGTRAKLVRGKDVRVGQFCTIDVVEAKELEVHETSTVKEQRKLSED